MPPHDISPGDACLPGIFPSATGDERLRRYRNQKFTPAGSGGKWITRTKRLAIYLRDGLACVYCGADGRLPDVHLQIDHYVRPEDVTDPEQMNHESNLVTCCRKCNSSKGNMSIRKWMRKLRRDFPEMNVTARRKRIERLRRTELQPYKLRANRIFSAYKTTDVPRLLERGWTP